MYLIPSAHAEGVKSAIEAANAQFSAAAEKGDGAALAALYSPDGQVMPPGSDPIRGTEGIQKFWQGALDSGVAAIGLKTIEVFGHGTTATEVGHTNWATRQSIGMPAGGTAWSVIMIFAKSFNLPWVMMSA
jgi:ketosteroid isomerase-like protein